MDCEICGQENASTSILMDNQKLIVCSNCSDLGEKTEETKVIYAKKTIPTPAFQSRPFNEFSMVEDFGKIIRQKRQGKNLSMKELAQKIFEKESFLHKIEQEKHIPDEKLARKLEKFFQIKLIE